MVLIPEERLLRYEERDKQRPENGMMYGSSHMSLEYDANPAPRVGRVELTLKCRILRGIHAPRTRRGR